MFFGAKGFGIFRASIYTQKTAGAIGTRITGVLARINMDRWGDKLKELLKEAGVTLYILAKYIDDYNLATNVIPKGYSWDKGETGRRKKENVFD